MNNQEKALRSHIRKAIKIVKEKRENKAVQEEQKLRNIIRKMIIEAKKVPKWDSYGKNNLDVMLMKTNFLDALETGYKALTTTEDQRKSYEVHIMQNLQRTLNLEKAKDQTGDQSNDLNEQDVNVTVGDGGLMGLAPDEEKQQEVDKDFEEFKVQGQDYSGLREAYEAFRLVQETLLTYWKKMDLEEDREIFYDNLMEQMNLYFDKWESELDLSPENPRDIDDTPMDDPEPEVELEPDEPVLDLDMDEPAEEEEEEEEGL